ncbi:mpv17-like protein [Battus philenor]|uniref:mpv17-like protein n=1 Tax=Battus philenor TaxID=42288 RepID=UPI0035CFC1C7
MMSKLANLWRTSLKKRPILTNTMVYATLYAAAELSQQTFNRINLPEKPELDLAAAARIVTVGSCLYSPTLYFWYGFLDRKFHGTTVKMVATKVASDQFIMTPILIGAFFTLMGIVEQKEDIFEELREKYVKTFLLNQAFWIPGQTINFFFVPPNLRVVFVAFASFLWINVLCFIKREKVEKKAA